MIKFETTGKLLKIELENSNILKIIIKDITANSKKFATVTVFKTKDNSELIQLIHSSIGKTVAIDGSYYEVSYKKGNEYVHEHTIKCENFVIGGMN